MTKITRSVLESYIACRYKAYLMLASNEAEPRQESEPRPQTNYEQLPAPLEQVVRAQEVSPLDGVKITPTLLSKGLPEVIGCLYETKLFSLRFDGIRKVPADCDIADFHYIPILLD